MSVVRDTIRESFLNISSAILDMHTQYPPEVVHMASLLFKCLLNPDRTTGRVHAGANVIIERFGAISAWYRET